MNKRSGLYWFLWMVLLAVLSAGVTPAQSQSASITAIKAGRLIDPETGTATTDQVIIIEGEKIKAVGALG